MVKGLQEHYTVASTGKHFAVYSVGKGAREGEARTDPQVSPREVENILLPPFKAAIKEAGLLGVMSSYNDYDSIPVTGSKYWLTQRLRNDFGFKGYVVSDSAAVEYLYKKHGVAADMKDAVRQSIEAGLNVKTNFTPPQDFILPLRELVKEGKVSIRRSTLACATFCASSFCWASSIILTLPTRMPQARIVNSAEHQEGGFEGSAREHGPAEKRR
jgi:beta-glucosidase